MVFMDTGLCIPESVATLAYQQAQLVDGKRDVQMFPIGTIELECPEFFTRLETERGVFHFRPGQITVGRIRYLSEQGRENEFLNLGPIGKPEIADRVLAGEKLVCVTERTRDGVEVRSAAGTEKTIDAQRDYFERTKDTDNTVSVTDLSEVIGARLAERN